VPEGAILTKAGLRPGQALILTKALGTGALMAAAMRGAARGRWLLGALDSMQQSNAGAATILAAHGARGCTDVTGFGLLGHLAEMARPSGVRVRLEVDAVPALPGAADVLAAGVLSSLHAANASASAVIANFDALRDARPHAWPLLFDPQTAGGLLAGVPPERAAACVEALRAAGYSAAAVVGACLESGDGGQLVEAAWSEKAGAGFGGGGGGS